MTQAHHADIWLIDLGDPVGREQAGRRPGVIVSSDRWNELPSGIVIVVPLTTAHRGLDSHIEIEASTTGLDETSYAKCEDVRAIADERLIHRFGVVPPDRMFIIGRALRYLLDL